MSLVELLTQLSQRDKELAEEGRHAVEAHSAELEALQAKAAELEKKVDRASHERDEYRKRYELATLELERLRRHLFGKKSDRTPEGQLSFDALDCDPHPPHRVPDHVTLPSREQGQK